MSSPHAAPPSALRRWFPPLRAQSDELLHLDLLRFIASVAIVLTHSTEFLFPAIERPRIHALNAGLPLFVDVFFVISGYVISHVYMARLYRPADWGRFWQRRVGRLYPLHLITQLLWLALYLAVVAAGFRGAHMPALDARCTLTTLFLLQAMVDCGGLGLNQVSWSISAEFAMYALFPLAAILFAGRRWLPSLVALAAFAATVWHYGAIEPWPARLDAWRALPAFLFGCAVYANRGLLDRLPRPAALLLAGSALMLAGGMLGGPIPVLLALAYTLPVLAAAADRRQAAAAVRRFAPLGQLTYSIYMIHLLAILVLVNMTADKALHLTGAAMVAVLLATYAVIGIAGWLSFVHVETPLRRLIDRLPLFGAATRHGNAAPTPRPDR